MTSKGPSHALLKSQVLPANVQEAHHACWAVKIQMARSRWVMNTMLFLLKCTLLHHADRTPHANQVWDSTGHVGLTEIAFLSFKTCFCNTGTEKRSIFLQLEDNLPKGQRSFRKLLSPLTTENSSGKLVTVQTCLQTTSLCGSQWNGCQGVYHLSPTLSEGRGVINCSGNANCQSFRSISHTTWNIYC